jgi:hypothetical protein
MTISAQQLEQLLADYSVILKDPALSQEEQIAIRHEQRFLVNMLADMQWQQLTDDQRQAKRKARIALLDKQSSQEGSAVEFTYEKHITELYDLIQATLRVISDVATSSLLSRLKAFLLAEKSFIDADNSFAKLKHMDYYLWQNFFSANIPQLEEMQVDASRVRASFHAMYKSWPNRPYKDI